MNPNVPSTGPEPTEAEIQHTAYLLWLESGQLPDRDLDNWLAAKELLRHHHGKSGGPKRRAPSRIPPPVPAAKAK